MAIETAAPQEDLLAPYTAGKVYGLDACRTKKTRQRGGGTESQRRKMRAGSACSAMVSCVLRLFLFFGTLTFQIRLLSGLLEVTLVHKKYAVKTLQFQRVRGRIPLSFARNLSMVPFAGVLQNNIRHSIIPTGIFLYRTSPPPPQRLLNDDMQNATPPTQAQSGATMSTTMPTMQHSRDRRFAYSSCLRSSEEEIQTIFGATAG